MSFAIREYQQRAINSLYSWWVNHTPEQIPLVVKPTGSGKSIVIAELVRLLFETWPADHPRTVVLVPSKELAEQNAEKLAAVLPPNRSVGYYSASLGAKCPDADVIVATIGSIYRDAHMLGSIRCVVIDEAHLVNPSGQGRYRQFLRDLSRYCQIVAVGLTATPFRGNGVWLTDGDDPLFHGIACEIKMAELLAAGYLAPLIRPVDAIATRIDTDGLSVVSGDYRIDDLSERVEQYIPGVVRDTIALAANRRTWIAFTPNVATAESLSAQFMASGVSSEVVCGETPKRDRERLVAKFRAGQIRCLVTVLALATGFDVPDVDCVIWCRPTRSPVLYVQGAGRGTRTAPGKRDCLWLDFSDTTQRLGPIDTIRGKARRKAEDGREAPYAVCPECAAHVRPASLLSCPECGQQLREPQEQGARGASSAAILSGAQLPLVTTYPVTDVRYVRHTKPGSPDSLRVDYYSGIRKVVSEWVHIEREGWAGARAAQWWARRTAHPVPETVGAALVASTLLARPAAVRVDESGRWPELVGIEWNESNRVTDQARGSDADARGTGSREAVMQHLRQLRVE